MNKNAQTKMLHWIIALMIAYAFGLTSAVRGESAGGDSEDEINSLFQEYISLKRELKPEPYDLAESMRKANSDLREDLERKNRKWNSELSLGANLARGNSDTTLLNLGFKTRWVSGKSQLDLLLDGSYEEADGEKTMEKGEGAVDFKHDLTQNTFFVALANIERDDQADLDYRTYVSPGLGAKYSRVGFKVSGSAGPAFVREKYRYESASDDISALLNQEIELRLNDRFKLFQGLKLLTPVADLDNYILTATGGAESELYKRLFFRLTLKNVYVHQPPEEKKQNDLSLRTSLVWKF